MKKFVYADNAATTQLDMEAFEAMKPFLLSEYGNPSQPYSFSRSAKKALAESRAVISECIGAQQEEIYFTSRYLCSLSPPQEARCCLHRR